MIIETKISVIQQFFIFLIFASFTGSQGSRHLSQSWLLRDICTFDNYQERDAACVSAQEIIGGEAADPLRFPYLISLQSPNSRVGYGCFFHFCGATLIAPQFVLTAAHCIYDIVADQASSSGRVTSQIYAALSPKCRHMANNGRAKVLEYWYHPQYSSITIENDIAILKLDRPLANTGPFIQYKPNSPLQINQQVAVAGWGDISPSENNDRMYNLRQLQRGDLSIVSWRECQAVMETFTSRNVVDRIMVCAYSYKTDSCAGDSGGPLIVTDDSSYMGNHSRDYQAGIVSWGPGQACVSGITRFPGVYTRVSAYVDWIDSILYPNNNLQIIDTPNIYVTYPQFTTPSGCRTQGGCTCKSRWIYDGVLSLNCDNPDNDPAGSWCVVESYGGCQPLSVVARTGEFWDRCRCAQDNGAAPKMQIIEDDSEISTLCNETMLGCKCQKSWTFGNQDYQGCNNPDEDVHGAWCYVNLDSCPRPKLLEAHSDKQFEYDYCKPGC
eukprot:TRINITY_DN11521_c0_g2_i1.p1 TRINITY_DN11521_c0_g2~~TRINITY_DN11521_c0_g2_i1.p1  ORF type:complete len:496 (-),score=48.93 TRINITY_DN11521_c0_g2_i1:256-1743(-)